MRAVSQPPRVHAIHSRTFLFPHACPFVFIRGQRFRPSQKTPDFLPQLPEQLFPGRAKAGWWTKAVQLDLEAKGLVAREKTKATTVAQGMNRPVVAGWAGPHIKESGLQHNQLPRKFGARHCYSTDADD